MYRSAYRVINIYKKVINDEKKKQLKAVYLTNRLSTKKFYYKNKLPSL